MKRGPIRRSLEVIVTVALAAVSAGAPAGDPRPPADAPFEAAAPAEPRMSRRAQRRATRRRPLPEAAPPAAPIGVTTTLASPFEHLGTAAIEPFIVHRGRPYAAACPDRQQFDLYLPKGCVGPLPLVIWIDGETWQSGSRSDCPVTWLVDCGYAVASIGYRPSGTAPFPAQLDDCLEAIAMLHDEAEIWGIDRDRICVAGAAAGGHLAALAGLWDEPTPARPPAAVNAICVIDAPTHLTTLGPAHDRAGSAASQFVGGPLPEFREVAQQASPLTHVSADDPPVLVVHARENAAVPLEQSQKFFAALRAAGVKSTLVTPADTGRLRLDRDSPTGQAVREFLDGTVGHGGPPAPVEKTP